MKWTYRAAILVSVLTGVVLLATALRIWNEGAMTIATGIQFALLVVVLYQMWDMPRRQRRFTATLEGMAKIIDESSREAAEIQTRIELAAPERAELEAWRIVGEQHGITLTIEKHNIN